MIPTTWEDPQVRATGNATLSGTILKNGETEKYTLPGNPASRTRVGGYAFPKPFTVHVAIDAGLGGVRVEMRVQGPVPRSGMPRHACE